jgi:DNA-binding transcriptional LysR family regulator
MHIKRIDLNLLVVAESLFRTLNVSLSAKELGLSQSAVSHALNRLRAHYEDPFFVRISKGIAPTRFAKTIREEVEEVVRRANELSRKKDEFEPRNAQGRIVLATTDYFESVVMSKFLAEIRKEAPHIVLSLRPTFGDLPKRDLEDGSIDIAIAGFYENLPEGFYRSRLFKDSFATACRKGHPIAKGRIGVDDFFKAEHALITLQGDFSDDMEELKAGGKRHRKIVYGSASFTGIAWVLEKSDLLLTAPRLLLETYESHFPIQVVDCPVSLDPIEIQMIWQEQTHRDPLRAWFRKRLKNYCTTMGG